MLEHMNLYTHDTIEFEKCDDGMLKIITRFRLVPEPPSTHRGGRALTQLYRAAEVHDYIRRNNLIGAHANAVASRRVAASRVDQERPGFAAVFAEMEAEIEPRRFPHVRSKPEPELSRLATEIKNRRLRRGEDREAVELITVHAVRPFMQQWRLYFESVYDVLRKGEHTYPTEATLIL